MQLLCNGVFVDLYENTKIQFTKENPLFSFDNLKCERTTQFSLPTTPNNDRLFELARIPAYNGEGMRRKFAARLQDGQVIKDGYLYVSAFNGKDYQAIIVTGEMVPLQNLKNAGKISEYPTKDPQDPAYWNPSNTAVFGQPQAYSQTAYSLFNTFYYANMLMNVGGQGVYSFVPEKMRPYISLYVLAQIIVEQIFGISFSANAPASVREMVYLPEQYVNSSGEEIATAGANIQLRYNLPDWNAIDLLKLLAYSNGLLLNFEDNTIEFVSLENDLTQTIDISQKLTDRKDIKRSLEGFAQHNIIGWEDADLYRLQNGEYIIDNDNIEQTRELYTIPAQPAQYINPYGAPAGLTDCGLLWDKYATDNLTQRSISPMGSKFLARFKVYEQNNNYLRPYDTYARVRLNSLMQSLCATSTQIQVSARMTSYEYDQIRPKTVITLEGLRYVWISSSWQANDAQFTLAKLP